MFSPILVLALASLAYQHLGPTPPPHGLPAIESYTISATQIRPGQTITGEVRTSTNVVHVDAKIEYRDVVMQQTAPGHFALRYTVPWFLPPWLHRAYTLQIVARSIDGVETVRDVPIRII